MNKKTVTVLVAAVAALVVGVGTTLAYLLSSSHPVINYFTIGNVTLSLTETTGDTYPMVPGTTAAKDPHLTVAEGSDACWLFFRMEKGNDFDRYISCAVADGWTPLTGETGVYYRRSDKATVPLSYPLLKGDAVQIRDAVTEKELAAITEVPTLTFCGYAVQAEGVDTAAKAWQLLQEKGE